jgi:cytochrome c2
MLFFTKPIVSIFFVKSILAIFFLVVAFISAISRLPFMGRTESKISSVSLTRIHKWSGFVFIGLFLVISYFCIRYVAFIGDKLSVRAVLHGFLALTLFAILSLKLSLVKFYRQFLKFVPQMGMTVFILSFEISLLSAGFFFLTRWWHPGMAKIQPSAISLSGEAQMGKELFDNKCSFCHYADQSETKIGPGLKGVLKKETLPVSGRPATPENIVRQLQNPYRNMPSFQNSLSEEDIKHLLAYLKTL